MSAEQPSAISDLIRRLGEPDGQPDNVATLAQATDDLVPELVALLDGADTALAAIAARWLGALGAEQSLGALAHQSLYGAPEVATVAIDALGRLPASQTALITLNEIFEAAERQALRPAAALALAGLAAQGEPVLSRRAAMALAGLAPDEVGPLLRRAMLRQASVLCVVVDAGLRVSPEGTVQALLEGIAHAQASSAVRQALCRPETARALVAQLSPANAPLLAPILARAASRIRTEADGGAPALYAQIVEPLLDLLIDTPDPLDRAPLLAALQEMGDPATARIAERLADAAGPTLGALVQVMDELGWQPTPARAGARYHAARGEWEACLSAGEEALAPLVEAFLAADVTERDAIGATLARLGWNPTEPELRVPYLVSLRRWRLLAGIGKPGTAQLCGLLAAERSAALQTLAPQPQAEQPKEPLPDGRAELRGRLIDALVRAGGADARGPLLASLRQDPSPLVRRASLAALRRLGPNDIDLCADTLACEIDRAVAGGEPADDGVALRLELLGDLAGAQGHLELLLRAASEDPDAGVRARAAPVLVARAEEAAAADRVALLELVVERLDPSNAPDLAPVLHHLGEPALERLVALLEDEGPDTSARGVVALVSIARLGAAWEPRLRRLLLAGTPESRRAVAQVYDELGEPPAHRDARAAYHLAKGQLGHCEALGRGAVAVLKAALPAYDWRTAGALVASLLRMGVPADDPLIDRGVARLLEVARHGAAGPLPTTADVARSPAREEERRAARAMLEELAELDRSHRNRRLGTR